MKLSTLQAKYSVMSQMLISVQDRMEDMQAKQVELMERHQQLQHQFGVMTSRQVQTSRTVERYVSNPPTVPAPVHKGQSVGDRMEDMQAKEFKRQKRVEKNIKMKALLNQKQRPGTQKNKKLAIKPMKA